MSITTDVDQDADPQPVSTVGKVACPSPDGRAVQPDPAGLPNVVMLVLLSVIPFWAIPVAHMASEPDTATGLFHYELPYYVANGRAAMERGNLVSYPNPYDPAPDAPSIYVHWLPWIFGLMTSVFHCDPGDLILAVTFTASLAFAVVTRRLIAHRLDDIVWTTPAFLFAMWGGGLLAVGGLLFGADSGSWADRLLQFDPGRGLWFLSWGRNALFPTEAIYHVLVGTCWLLESRGSHFKSTLCLISVAATHPWSGLELSLTITLFRILTWYGSRNTKSARHLGVSFSVLLIFLTYYLIWLPSFPSHSALQKVWHLDWSLSWSTATLAYLPVAIPCGISLRRAYVRKRFTTTEQLLSCALLVAVGLAFHDRLVSPIQPLHFTRGYIWMPMFLLALPVIVEWCQGLLQGNRMQKALPAVAAVLLLSDNLAFCFVHVQRQLTARDGFHLSLDERSLISELQKFPPATVLTESETLNYLLPAFVSHRPWLGHQFNTPDYAVRRKTFADCFPDGPVNPAAIPSDIEILVLRRRDSTELAIRNGNWQEVGRTVDWSIFRRR